MAQEDASAQEESPPVKKTSKPRRGWVRRILRWARISFVIFCFVVLIAGMFLNHVGLPEGVKRRVIAQLKERGWDVEFSRLRLRWYRGIVAEHLHLRNAKDTNSPQVFVADAECSLHWKQLAQFKVAVSGVRLAGGRLFLPYRTTNGEPEILAVNDVRGELRFTSSNSWDLNYFQASVAGVAVQVSGAITNAFALRDLSKKPPTVRKRKQPLWATYLDYLNSAQFQDTPRLTAFVEVDAANIEKSRVNFSLAAKAILSPWLEATNFLLSARVQPPLQEGGDSTIDLSFNAEQGDSLWGKADLCRLQLRAQAGAHPFYSTNASMTLDVENAKTKWGEASRAAFNARTSWTNDAFQTEALLLAEGLAAPWLKTSKGRVSAVIQQPKPGAWPAHISAEIQVEQPETAHGKSQSMQLLAQTVLHENPQPMLVSTNLPWEQRLSSIPLDLTATVYALETKKLKLDQVFAKAHYVYPRITTEISSALYQGDLLVGLGYNLTNRLLSFKGFSNFDPHKIGPLLTPRSQRWMSSYTWSNAPTFRAEGEVILPHWTNRQPDWAREVLPTLSVDGRFQVQGGGYKGVTFTAAESPFIFTNKVWKLPQLVVERPEGRIEAEYESDPFSRFFHWRLRSSIDPKAVSPLFTKTNEQRIFNFFEFTTPPILQGELWGRWGELENLGAKLRVSVSNAAYRGQSITEASTQLEYTNQVFTLLYPQARRTNEWGSARLVAISIPQQKVYISNAFGNLSPYAICRMIGTNVTKAIEPYQFEVSPNIRVDGVIDTKRRRYEEDLHFEVSGGKFKWLGFQLQSLKGNLDWVGRTLTLTNAKGNFMRGDVRGHAFFDFSRTNKGADFNFQVKVAEADLPELVGGYMTRSNKLEGAVTGELIVTKASTSEDNSWLGYGEMHLRDGLLWDIPMFGLFSPVLNAFIPGLGNSRAREGKGTFIITNSVLHTKNLEIRATAMRMQFDGTTDFKGRVDALAEAELLRDVPAIGLVISKILWPVTKLFEYELSGTLAHPKAEPRYVIPKIVLLPFQSIKTIMQMIPEETPPKSQ